MPLFQSGGKNPANFCKKIAILDVDKTSNGHFSLATDSEIL
jgi:hypothetical protein